MQKENEGRFKETVESGEAAGAGLERDGGVEAAGDFAMGLAEEEEADRGEEEVRQGAAGALAGDGGKDEFLPFGEAFAVGAAEEAGVVVSDGEEVDAAHEEDRLVGAIDFAEIGKATAIIFGDLDDAGANIFGSFGGGEAGAGGGDGPEEASVEYERRGLLRTEREGLE